VWVTMGMATDGKRIPEGKAYDRKMKDIKTWREKAL